MLHLLPGKRRRWQKFSSSYLHHHHDAHKRSRNDSPDHTRLLPTPDSDDLSPSSTSPVPPEIDFPSPCPDPHSLFPTHLITIQPSQLPVPQPQHSSSSLYALSLSKRPDEWETDMISFIAASKFCREQAVACSLLSDGIPDDVLWPPSLHKIESVGQMSKQKKKKKIGNRNPVSGDSSSKALNVKQCNSWRIVKKLLSKQFMPFSTNSRSGKVSTKILHSRNDVVEVKMECCSLSMGQNNKKKLKGKENAMKCGNENRAKSITMHKHSILINTFLNKASNAALQVCDVLKLD